MSVIETKFYKVQQCLLEQSVGRNLSYDDPILGSVYDLTVEEIRNMGFTLGFFEKFFKCFTQDSPSVCSQIQIDRTNIKKYISLVTWIGHDKVSLIFGRYIIRYFIFTKCELLDLVYDDPYMLAQIKKELQDTVNDYDHRTYSSYYMTLDKGSRDKAFERVPHPEMKGFWISYVEQYIMPCDIPKCKQEGRKLFYIESDLHPRSTGCYYTNN